MSKNKTCIYLHLPSFSEPRVEQLFRVDEEAGVAVEKGGEDTQEKSRSTDRLESLSKTIENVDDDSPTSPKKETHNYRDDVHEDVDVLDFDNRTVGVVIGVLLTVISLLVGGILYVSYRQGLFFNDAFARSNNTICEISGNTRRLL